MPKRQNAALLAVGKGITNDGGGNWAAWSGVITVNDNTVEMLNFITPRALIVKNFQYYLSSFLDTHYYIGWNLIIDGITIIESRWKATDTAHFNDIDMNSFIIPANSNCIIQSHTNQAGDVPTYAVMTLKETEA